MPAQTVDSAAFMQTSKQKCLQTAAARWGTSADINLVSTSSLMERLCEAAGRRYGTRCLQKQRPRPHLEIAVLLTSFAQSSLSMSLALRLPAGLCSEAFGCRSRVPLDGCKGRLLLKLGKVSRASSMTACVSHGGVLLQSDTRWR